MGLQGLFRAHPVWSVAGSVGVLVSIWGWLADARELWTAGVKAEYLQLFGFVLFVFSVVSVVARQQQHLEARLSDLPDRISTGALPNASEPSLPKPEKAIEAPRAEGRQFAPASFVKELAAFLKRDHTDLQLSAFLAPHMGQWIRARGTLRTTADHGSKVTAIVRLSGASEVLFVDFETAWRSQLARLSPNQDFDFDAQIIENHRGQPQLGKAELL